MAFDESSIIIDHDLDRLGTDDKVLNHVAHVLCEQGQLDFIFNSEPFTLRAGDSMIVRLQRLIEDKRPSADLRATVIYVTPEVVEVATPRSNYGIRGSLALFHNPIMSLNEQQQARLRRDFDEVESRQQHTEHRFREEELYCALQMTFLDFFDFHAGVDYDRPISARNAEIMAQFIQLLQQGNYIKHRELNFYADKLCVTPKYLSEVSKDISGMGANYWINRFATIHIRRLLHDRSMSFTQIADIFEFSSPSYFNRFVQNHLGKTPSAFRE